ncbi:aspartate beta-hydroxylase domain-containing protein 2-like [Tubulanus polymorphus]|uniref:aspartate beta-hydroxylase domain-containing protein 2-like n=1 Tax=Tubulanus polymorphus TaxID=672921 RepID=UPI003DA56464
MAFLFTIDCYHLLGFALGVITTIALVWSKLKKELKLFGGTTADDDASSSRGNDNDEEKDDDRKFSKCKSAGCVRCSRKNSVISAAAELLDNYQSEHPKKLPRRIESAVDNYEEILTKLKGSMQQPNIFFLPGLRTSPFWNSNSFSKDANVLKKSFNEINKEFCTAYAKTAGWITNVVPTGEWHIYHLINQGQVVEENAKCCPKTMKIARQMDSAMKNNLFGNVSFSVIIPGTHITPHYGPCNFRIRAHLALLAPTQCSLTVSGISKTWNAKDCLFFDDSFLHEVQHTGTDDHGPRAVLIIDLWHPDLKNAERNVIDYIFPGSGSGEKVNEHPIKKRL